MPLHPHAQAFLSALKDAPQPPAQSLAEFRRAVETVVGQARALPIERVEEISIPGGDRQELRLRAYVPSGEKPMPAIVWAHGGSFTRGSLDTFDAGRRAFANLAQCIVVAVDQRLAPEAQFPAPVEDVYAASSWAADHIAELGGDPVRLGIGGESSGGNLAAAAALLARDRGQPKLAFQVLLMPLVDATCSSDSALALAEDFGLTRRQLLWCYEQYAPGVRRDDPRLSPLHEPDLRDLPPAVVVTLEFDPVRDEGESYAKRLAEAGVPVRHVRVEGMVHHFPGAAALQATVAMTRETIAALR